MAEDIELHILRGKRIEEFSPQELVTLANQINDELPTLIDHLGQGDLNRLLELELIEDELERRHEKR
jgi:hypothetical protein